MVRIALAVMLVVLLVIGLGTAGRMDMEAELARYASHG
jgi:hypothetical protein